MAWKGVITNSGSELLAQWTTGKTLTITRAAAGTGRVSETAMLAQTALVDEKQAASILSNKTTAQGQKLQLQVTPQTLGYALNQFGVWAKLGSGAEKMIALFQTDTDAGVEIPSKESVPDYVYTFYGLLEVTGTGGTLQVTIDPEALATTAAVAQAITAHNESADAHKTEFDGKQNKITTAGLLVGDGKGGVSAQQFDTEPTKDSSKLLTSGAVAAAMELSAAVTNAAEYSAAATYALGDYCTHDGKLYRCTTAITEAEAWTEAHWTETSVSAELIAIYTALQNKASLATQQTVEKTNAPMKSVTLDASELQAYLDSLPRLLTETLEINVTGDLTGDLHITNFYGSASWLEIQPADPDGTCTISGTVTVGDCSVPIRLIRLHVQVAAGKTHGLYSYRSMNLSVEKCSFSGPGSETGVHPVNSMLHLSNCSISGFAWAVQTSGDAVVTIANDVEDSQNFHDNSIGAYVWHGGLVEICDKTPSLLGGASHQKTGGLIVGPSGTLL